MPATRSNKPRGSLRHTAVRIPSRQSGTVPVRYALAIFRAAAQRGAGAFLFDQSSLDASHRDCRPPRRFRRDRSGDDRGLRCDQPTHIRSVSRGALDAERDDAGEFLGFYREVGLAEWLPQNDSQYLLKLRINVLSFRIEVFESSRSVRTISSRAPMFRFGRIIVDAMRDALFQK